ncbi:MAG TPA: hypothetical protein VNS32_08195 [Flavisolibacter sp.]|nr:hypothetical protein [Flavisolibacter sp.]
MTITLSNPDQRRFEEIKKTLSLLGAKESTFLQVELLFYEALSISREYGHDLSSNHFLAKLKQVQNNEYEKTKERTKKSTQREQNIRRFITQFKKALSLN